MDKFEAAIGRKTLGNCAASGTTIINELGDEHVKTGYPIVYTSADSVFQIACHEEVIPVDELYRICEIAREILVGDYAVARVIARPFVGKGNGNYTRTERRKDFSLAPTSTTVLDLIKKKGMTVAAIGKIEDIFEQRKLQSTLINVENVFQGCPKLFLNDRQTERVKNGCQITWPDGVEGLKYRLYSSQNKFLCLSECKNKRLVMIQSFWSALTESRAEV